MNKKITITLCALAIVAIVVAIWILVFLHPDDKTSVQPKQLCIQQDVQSIVQEAVDKEHEALNPLWSTAIMMDVHTGAVIAAYSTDSIAHYADTSDYGMSLFIPLCLNEALEDGVLSSDATASIHRSGIVIDSIVYTDSHPRDREFDIPTIIASGSVVGCVTLLNQAGKGRVQRMREESSQQSLTDICYRYCQLLTDTCPQHSGHHQVIMDGLFRTVWDDQTGTVSKTPWGQTEAQSDLIALGGKTGSCILRDSAQQILGYSISFVGYFPAEHPDYCCAVVFHQPASEHWGQFSAGLNGGRTVRRIAERVIVRSDKNIHP